MANPIGSPISSDCEPCTTLGATRSYNGTTPTGFHADQKTMGALSFGYGWLVCAFHFTSFDNQNALLQSVKGKVSSHIYILACG